jgi:hypothetical protein
MVTGRSPNSQRKQGDKPVNEELIRQREVADSYTIGYAQGLMERPARYSAFLSGAFFGVLASAACGLVIAKFIGWL